MTRIAVRTIDAGAWRTMRAVRLAPTGERQPLPSYPEYAEIAMTRLVRWPGPG